MATILHRWRRAGHTPADVRAWAHAAALMRTNVPPELKSLLTRYGLQGLTKWATEAIVQGKSQAQIVNELFDHPVFKSRFPGIENRRKAKLPPMSVDEYLEYESLASSLGSTWGLRLSKKEVDALISNDVSPSELEQRFNIAATAVFESAPETRGELSRLHGANLGDLMRYFMNPKEELGILENRFRTAEIAGAALRTGYGQVEKSEARQLMEAGLDEDRAMEGFGTLSRIRPLFSPMHLGETEINRQVQLEFLAGDIEAAQIIERRAQQRIAQFEGQGGFTPGREGFTTGVAVRT
jgi:hypothetical protein